MNAQLGNAAASGVWMTDYADAVKLASRTKLPLVLHFDATWCGACRRMESEVLNRSDVRNQLGRTVIGCRIDADLRKDLIAEFGISTLPTEVIVQPDGSRGSRFVGYVSLSSYKSRLKRIAEQNQSNVAEKSIDHELDDKASVAANERPAQRTRSCLIVKHDGKMVGLGGFSPVALSKERQWKKGSDEWVASHEGVCYFFQSQEEVVLFRATPDRFIPRLHGCDPVMLFTENRAASGAIEFGSFYEGRLFFFANHRNRIRFESNPKWYVSIEADAMTEKDPAFDFLHVESADN